MAVTLKITHGEDLRRLTVADSSNFTLGHLYDTIRKLFALNEHQFARLAVKYTDDEGDLVTISSPEELLEALNLARNAQPPILRIQLEEKKQPQPEDVLPPWARRGFPFGHHANPFQAFQNAFQRGQQQSGQPGHGCPGMRGCGRFGRRPGCPEPESAPAPNAPTLEDPRHQHTLYLVENPYGHGHFVCDGCSLPGQGRSYHCGSCNFDLHVSCPRAREQASPWQRSQIWFALHNQAMTLMEKRTTESITKAKELLQEQLKTSPYHQASPLYNIACCEALLGHPEEALKALQDAVTAGWNDAKHTEEDADLESLRNLDSFKAIIASLKADAEDEEDEDDEVEIHVEIRPVAKPAPQETKPVEPQPAEVKPAPVVPLVPLYPAVKPTETKPVEAPKPAEVKPAEPAKPAEPQLSASVSEFEEKLRTLEAMGFADRRRNIATLVRTRGDLVAAIQILLNASLPSQ